MNNTMLAWLYDPDQVVRLVIGIAKIPLETIIIILQT